MKTKENFDAVLMLTWSDWKTEPRSNRYHYATRFAKSLPVLFLQHRYGQREKLEVEASGIENIDLVHVSCGLPDQEIADLRALLYARGIKRPLFWIYDSMNYGDLLAAMPRAFRVYHATEDYLLPTEGWTQDMQILADSLKSLMLEIDFLVSCAEGVATSYLTVGGYKGPYVIAQNGCDAEFFLERCSQAPLARDKRKPVALFQGGINLRLDYPLLMDLARRMPDWEFRFCGMVHSNDGWERLSALPNVTYLGVMSADELPGQMCAADVGLIPYIQDQWIRNSYPLKAYEYVACGLPVVSVPVTSLERETELFATAVSAEEFEAAIRLSLPKRADPLLLKKRILAARHNSYDARFALMEAALMNACSNAQQARKKLRVLMLYDSMISMHVSTIREHLEAFQKYSRYEFTYVSTTPEFWGKNAGRVDSLVDLSIFDVAFVHYSTRLSVDHHLDKGFARALAAFSGLKLLFIQDEYEATETARNWMEQIHFDVVYTCVPQESVEAVYPSYRFPATEFLPTLTGYVPEAPSLESFGKPLGQREIAIAYRGRELHPVYGDLGNEKFRIGAEMKILATMRNIPIDIEVDDTKRIYGDAWYEFLGSARATLGTESGSNIFDVDGGLRKEVDLLRKENPDITFKELAERVLAPHEGFVKMNQISPKIFEAIRLRTALILFEGSYSGVVEANKHYIPLKKDFSNVDEVFAKLADDDFLISMTDRAYEDVVASQWYSYRRFVEGIDTDVESRFWRNGRRQQLLSATFVVKRDGSLQQALPLLPDGIWAGAHPAGYPSPVMPVARSSIFPSISPSMRPRLKSYLVIARSMAIAIARPGWRCMPIEMRQKVLRLLRR